MKITRKILQDLIKEETIKVLSEEPSPADEEKAEHLKNKILARLELK